MTDVTHVTLRRGYETIDMVVRDDDGFWTAETVQIEWTSHGGRVGAVVPRSFPTQKEARANANERFTALVAKGFRRTR